MTPIAPDSFTVTAQDGKSLAAYRWRSPSQNPAGLVQIVHGMAEHSLRYGAFASFLAAHGFDVVAHDQRGHGNTDPESLGYIAEGNAFSLHVQDVETVTKHLTETDPDLPRIVFAHSMGSFVVQRYMQRSGDRPAAIIYSGSNGPPPAALTIGVLLAKFQRIIQGDDHPSKLIRDITFGPYNRTFKPNRTDKDWLSRDPDTVDAYINDPKSGMVMSTSFFHDFFRGLKQLHRHSPFSGPHSDIPILLISGSEDPVGMMGRGVQKLADKLRSSGVKKVDLKLYPKARHELLNEVNREQVYADLLGWIETEALSTP